ncbi:hypothetical protein [Nocardia sp. CY41]|uniref:hypothetical protein n=1 Tax=Nocardia sp. CY41 TaxID=2608686 RepID=UPI00135C3AD2|nr:hypothetical protein [Nocardia sp. CY41]
MPILLARVIAVPVSLWLIAALAVNADYRADNIFALPDAAFSLLLLIAAALPTRPAVPALITGFLFGAGVITVAALDRFDRTDTPQGILNLVVAAVYLTCAVLLMRRQEAAATA